MRAPIHTADNHPAIDIALIEKAAAWMARLLADDTTDQDRLNCQHWRERNPRHEQAWQHICQITGKFAQVPNQTHGTQVLEDARRFALSRRQFLQWMGLTGLGVTGTWLGLNHTALGRGVMAKYQTGVGESRDISLADGTRLLLNTNSAVDVEFTSQLRRITLHHGEIFIETGRESPRREFTVDIGYARLIALGTEFNVRKRRDSASLAVLDGTVEVRSESLTRAVRLNAGQQTSLDARQIAPPSPLTHNTTGWQRGVMVAEQMRVADFLTEIRRYRRGFVFYDDRVADLQISGVFSIRDTDRALHNLAVSLPVDLIYRTDYWVKVIPRENG